MSPENTHNTMGMYMEALILGVILQYMVSTSLINLLLSEKIRIDLRIREIRYKHVRLSIKAHTWTYTWP